jgi:NCS1 family nucleobase:cation symporter-1
VSVSGWAGGAAVISLGLTISQTMIATIITCVIISALIVMTGQLGAYWHVGFPMWNRIVWGLRLAYFPLFNRIILSFTWSSTQAWFGAQCLKVSPIARSENVT